MALMNNAWLVCQVQKTSSPDLVGEWSDSEESQILKEAGALKTAVYYMGVENQPPEDSFWDSSFINYYSQAIAFEANETPRFSPDLCVHVMRPLKQGEELVSLREVEACQLDARELLKNVYGVSVPEDAYILSEEESEEFVKMEDENDGPIESIEIPDELGKLLISAVEKKSFPINKNAWTLHSDHKKIGRAGLIIINIRNEDERADAERTRQQIEKLRTSQEISRDIFNYQDERRRVTILIANLDNARDPELKKVFARIKRVVRNNSSNLEYEF